MDTLSRPASAFSGRFSRGYDDEDDITESSPLTKQPDVVNPAPASIQTSAPISEDEKNVLRSHFAEFFACIFLGFLHTSAIYTGNAVTFDSLTTGYIIFVALVYGLGFGAVLYAFSFPNRYTISIAETRHMSPIVTFALTVTGRITIWRFLTNILVQAGGVVVGAWLAAAALAPDVRRRDNSFIIHSEGASSWQGGMMEVFISFVSTLVIVVACHGSFSQELGFKGSSGDSRENTQQSSHEVNCLVSGLVMFVCVCVGVPVSGGLINPFLALSLSMMSNQWKSVWIFFVANFAGGGLAALIGWMFLRQSSSSSSAGQQLEPKAADV